MGYWELKGVVIKEIKRLFKLFGKLWNLNDNVFKLYMLISRLL